MTPFRIAINLASLQQGVRQALQTAAQLGADAVELDARGEIRPEQLSHTGRRQLRKQLDDLRLRVAAVSFQTRRGYHVPEDLDRRVDATKKAMSFAYDLGASVVVNQVGYVPEGPEEAASDVMLQALADIGRHGQRCGAMLAARTGSESGPALARLIQALPEGSLAVDFDPGGLVVHGFSPDEALEAVAADVQHVHARDGVRDLARGRGVEVQLGRGSVDFARLLAILEQHGYRGYVTIERREADDAVAEAADAVAYLRSLTV